MKKTIALAMMVAFAGTAAAQQPADKKPATPATPATPAKKEAPPATPAKQEPPKAAEAKKPPAELADMAKMMAGNWKCTGKGMDPATGQMVDSKGTFKAAMDLDKWWIKGEWTG